MDLWEHPTVKRRLVHNPKHEPADHGAIAKPVTRFRKLDTQYGGLAAPRSIDLARQCDCKLFD